MIVQIKMQLHEYTSNRCLGNGLSIFQGSIKSNRNKGSQSSSANPNTEQATQQTFLTMN